MVAQRKQLEIAKPRIGTPSANARVPAAERVDSYDNCDPDEIDPRQGEAPAGWFGDWEVCEVRRLKHRVDFAVAHIADDDCEDVDGEEMEEVVEHRHFAVDQCGTQDAWGAVVD